MSSGAPLKDQAARLAIVTDLDTCMLVEAGAGSGKTRSLVERMVALVGEGRCQAGEMAALTFTRKAAAEMKARFRMELERQAAAEVDPARRQRLREGVERLHDCFVGTMHSFCAALLRERPVEAGLDPGFLEMEDLEDQLLLREAWNDYLRQVQRERPQALHSLEEKGVRARALWGVYQALSTYPEVTPACRPVPQPDLAAVSLRTEKFIRGVARFLPRGVPEERYDELQKRIARLQRRLHFLGPGAASLIELLRLCERTPPRVVFKRWDTRQDAECALEELKSFREEVACPFLRQWREYLYPEIIDFVQPAVQHCAGMRQASSRLNFQDLLLRARDLLRDHPHVRRYFQRRWRRVLVDEFQDTDPLQAEILFYLTGTDVEERDWRLLAPRAGSLFVVGDPKQSIYRFRRADIDTYNEVRELIEQAGGRTLYLTTNFRSVHAVGQWANERLGNVLARHGAPYQAAFAGLETVEAAHPDSLHGVWRVKVAQVERHAQEAIARADAEWIAEFIRRALEGGLRLTRSAAEQAQGLTPRPVPGDFLLLFRYKARMDIYAQELEARGIPYEVSGSEGFAASQEVGELIMALQALLDPEDPVKLLALLRSRLVKVSDDDLYRFRAAGGRFHLEWRAPHGFPAQEGALFEGEFARLRECRELLAAWPPSAALRAIVERMGILPAGLSSPLPARRAGYLLQALELVAAEERRGQCSAVRALEYLLLLRETGVEEDLELAPGRDVVRLMNLHKAKGLEAPVVFLANPGKNVTRTPELHIERRGSQPRGHFVVQRQNGWQSEVLALPPDWDALQAEEQRYAEAEEDRLLYVAGTRARSLLIISDYPARAGQNPWQRLAQGLPELPQLPEAGQARLQSGASRPAPSAEDFHAARLHFLGPAAPSGAPTYAETSITAIVKQGAERPPGQAAGRGVSWGRVVHRLLEELVRDGSLDLERLAANLLAEEGRPGEEAAEMARLARDIAASELWGRLRAARRRLVELPFAVKVPAGGQGFPRDTVVTGVVDLVFEEDDGWVLADYKSDAVADEAHLAALADYYAPQVRLYRAFLERQAGIRVKEAGLYFLAAGRWVVVEM